VVTRRGGLNPNAVRQISSGSIAGMLLPLSLKVLEEMLMVNRCSGWYGRISLL
jgi:hypothetical protein